MLTGILARLSLTRLLLLGFSLRLGWILLCPNEPISDQAIYHFSATQLAEGYGYVDQDGRAANYWPVGYAALLAPFYALFGARPPTAFGVNLALWLGAIAGAYLLGRELFGERAGRLSGLLVAVHPTFVMHTTLIASETPFCALLPWALWLVVRAQEAERRAALYAVSAGVVIGAASYVRPPALLLLACPFAFGLLRRKPLGRVALQGGLVLAAALLVLVPWGLRNQAEFGQFSITSFNGGANLWMGNNPDSDGSYVPLPAEVERLPAPERDRLLKERALSFIRAEPLRYVALCLRRVGMSLRSDTIAAVWNEVGIRATFGDAAIGAFKALCTGAHWALLASLVLGVGLFRRGRLERVDLELALTACLLAVPFVFIVGGNRYMVPLVPLLCLWCASRLRASWATQPSRALEPSVRAPAPAASPSVAGLSRGLMRKLLWVCALGVLVYAAIPLYADGRAVAAGLGDVSSRVLIAATLLAVGNFVVRFARWAYYLHKLEIHVPVGESMLVFLSGFAMSITPAKMGEVLKAMMLRESHDVPIARSAPIVVAERVTDVAGLVLLGGLGMHALPGGGYVAVGSILAVLCLALAASSRRIGEALIRLASGNGKRAQLERKLLEAHRALHGLMSPWSFFLATLLSVVAWGLQGLCLAVVAGGYPDVNLSPAHAMVAYCAPLLAGTLAMIPGGLGLTEASMAGVISRLGGSAATAAIAASITIVVRAATFWLAIALGFIALFSWQVRRLALKSLPLPLPIPAVSRTTDAPPPPSLP